MRTSIVILLFHLVITLTARNHVLHPGLTDNYTGLVRNAMEKMRPGDLICFGGSKARRNGRYKRIYHIAIYIGNGKTMESSSTYNNVVIRDRGVFKKSEIPVVVRP